jgi:hypothetical protein
MLLGKAMITSVTSKNLVRIMLTFMAVVLLLCQRDLELY